MQENSLDQASAAAEIYVLCVISHALVSLDMCADVVSDSNFGVDLSRRQPCLPHGMLYTPVVFVFLLLFFFFFFFRLGLPFRGSSHGKRPSWRHEFLDSALVRHLDDLADAAASSFPRDRQFDDTLECAPVNAIDTPDSD